MVDRVPVEQSTNGVDGVVKARNLRRGIFLELFRGVFKASAEYGSPDLRRDPVSLAIAEAKAARVEKLSELFRNGKQVIWDESYRSWDYVKKHPFIPLQILATGTMGLSGHYQYEATNDPKDLGIAKTGKLNCERNITWLFAIPLARLTRTNRFDKHVMEMLAKSGGAAVGALTNAPHAIYSTISLCIALAPSAIGSGDSLGVEVSSALMNLGAALSAITAYALMSKDHLRVLKLMKNHRDELDGLYNERLENREKVMTIIRKYHSSGVRGAYKSEGDRKFQQDILAGVPSKEREELHRLFIARDNLSAIISKRLDEISRCESKIGRFIYDWLPGLLLTARGISFTAGSVLSFAFSASASPVASAGLVVAGLIFTAAALSDLEGQTKVFRQTWDKIVKGIRPLQSPDEQIQPVPTPVPSTKPRPPGYPGYYSKNIYSLPLSTKRHSLENFPAMKLPPGLD